MKTSIKMIAVATLASGAALAEGYGHNYGVTSTDVSSFSSASVESGSVIVTSGNGAAYSNQVVGAGAQNQASAGANYGRHSGVSTEAATSGASGAFAASQSGAIGNAGVIAGTEAQAAQVGTASASAANRYHRPTEQATSEAGVASASGAGTGANGFGITGQLTSAANASEANATGHHNNVSTSANTIGATKNAGISFGSAGSVGLVGQEGSASAIVR